MKTELRVAGFTLSMGTRRRRRALVIVIYLFLSALLCAALLWAPWALGSVLWFLFLVGLINRVFFGGLTTRGLVGPFASDIRPLWFRDDPPPASRIDRWIWRRSPSRKDLQADEREDRLRDRVHYRSYRILTLLTYVVWGLFAIVRMGPFLGMGSLPFDFALMVAAAVAMLALTLPQAILLWTEPDMETEG
ncbi:MAG: hypothetical protein ABSD67_03945 [Terracidiphilus sp.]|jgi:hypothetical protein